MSKKKKKIREFFRTSVFERDGHKCRICGHKPLGFGQSGLPLDAHHITPREIMPYGGYVKENGISLCNKCHIYAEECLNDDIPRGFDNDLMQFKAENLYKLINSSYEKAYEASLKLED